MTDNENSKGRAETEEKKADFVDRVVRIVDQQGVVVEEDGLGFFKGNAVSFPVEPVRPTRTRQAQLQRSYIVVQCKCGAGAPQSCENHRPGRLPNYNWIAAAVVCKGGLALPNAVVGALAGAVSLAV